MKVPDIPADWPNRAASRHIHSAPHLWHVQDMGDGPLLLLLHGAGGATHSFRHLMPLLAHTHRVVALDLPGQGFTVLGARHRCGLDDMADDIITLATREKWPPATIIGHSAGAAIALRIAERTPTNAVIGINAALGRFDGIAGWLFPALARVLSLVPMVSQVFSKLAGTSRQVHQLLASTGSQIDAQGAAQYLHLLRNPTHISATLAMMSRWNLDGLLRRLPQQTCPCLLITAHDDSAVPPKVSERAALQRPHTQWTNLPNGGHLVHEVAAQQVADLILAYLASQTNADGPQP